MFSLFISLFIYLIQIGYNHLHWHLAVSSAAKFLFVWNFIFALMTITFFGALALGVTTLLFKIPFFGVGAYRFNEQIRQTGIAKYMGKSAAIWMVSKVFILTGSFYLAYENVTSNELIGIALALIFFGFLIRKLRNDQTNISMHSKVIINTPNLRKEKDVSPKQLGGD